MFGTYCTNPKNRIKHILQVSVKQKRKGNKSKVNSLKSHYFKACFSLRLKKDKEWRHLWFDCMDYSLAVCLNMSTVFCKRLLLRIWLCCSRWICENKMILLSYIFTTVGFSFNGCYIIIYVTWKKEKTHIN